MTYLIAFVDRHGNYTILQTDKTVIQSSLGNQGGLVPGDTDYTTIHRCSSPIVGPLYPQVLHPQIHPTSNGNFSLSLAECSNAKHGTREDRLYIC